MKSDGLLLNILPAEVATELKTSGTTKARHFDNVTVLFTDFVNFTNAGERMSAQELIDELHTCFKAFDEITAKYGIEKIKTIGGKWADFEESRFNANAQPFYVMLDSNGNLMKGSDGQDINPSPADFNIASYNKFLESGIQAYKNSH